MNNGFKFGPQFGALSAFDDMHRKLNPLGSVCDSMKVGASLGLGKHDLGLEKIGSAFAKSDLGLAKYDHSTAMGILRQSDLFGVGGHHSLFEQVNRVCSSTGLGHLNAFAVDSSFGKLSASARVLAIETAFTRHEYGSGGLADLSAKMNAVLGDSSLLASVDGSMRLRDYLGSSFGADVASQWDRLSAASFLPSVATLGFDGFEHPTAVLAMDSIGDLMGSLSWLSESLDVPVVSVAAVRRYETREFKTKKLRVSTRSAVVCAFCDSPGLEPEFEASLISDDEIVVDVRLALVCLGCMRRNQTEPGFAKRCIEMLIARQSGLPVLSHEVEDDAPPESGVYLIGNAHAEDE